MFELLLQGERAWKAQLPAGLYSLALPEGGIDIPHAVDALLLGRPGALRQLKAEPSIVLPQWGGLISNLRLWENIILPRWYHAPPLAAECEAQLLALVEQLLPQVPDVAAWLHRTVFSVPAEERALAGLLRSLLAPAPWIWIEADWQSSLPPATCERAFDLLQQVLREQQRLAIVFACDTQAANAMSAWQGRACTLEWNLA